MLIILLVKDYPRKRHSEKLIVGFFDKPASFLLFQRWWGLFPVTFNIFPEFLPVTDRHLEYTGEGI